MGFESVPVAGGQERVEKTKAPERLKAGLMEAGSVAIQDRAETSQSSSEKKAAERAPSIDVIREHFFPKGAQENLNQRAAFESLIGESKVALEELGALMKVGSERQGSIRKAFNETVDDYLEAWRSTASDKGKRLQKAREKFAEAVKNELH